MRSIYSLIFVFAFLYSGLGQMPTILDMEKRAAVKDQWLTQRFERVLPPIMRREGIDMWLLISREYNEDPVLKTMLPSNWLSARRTTMLVIYDNGEELETLACARYNVGEIFKRHGIKKVSLTSGQDWQK